jgi:hypothetical protein
VIFPLCTYIFKYMICSRNNALYVQSIYGNIEIIVIYCYLQPIMVKDRNCEATAIECGFTFGCPPRASPDNSLRISEETARYIKSSYWMYYLTGLLPNKPVYDHGLLTSTSRMMRQKTAWIGKLSVMMLPHYILV